MHLAFRLGSDHFGIDVQRTADARFAVTVNGVSHVVAADLVTPSTLRMTIDGCVHLIHVLRIGNAVHVAFAGGSYVLEPDTPAPAETDTSMLANPLVVAPMPGKVLKILVTVDQQVAAGEALLILEAMKMETRILAEGPATVRRLTVEEGQMVDGGALLVELEPIG